MDPKEWLDYLASKHSSPKEVNPQSKPTYLDKKITRS